MASVEILWDASGFAKRYYSETGQAAVNAVFAAVPPQNMTSTPWGYAETYSILLQRYNDGTLDSNAFRDAVTELRTEVLGRPGFRILSISDAMIFGSLSVMRTHSLNSTDAAILSAFLRFQRALPSVSPPCLLVASDKRLLRAAESEGLKTLNPELLPAADMVAFLAAL